MMTLVRRLVLLASLAAAVFCFVSLMNVTASNPTGRRYSSEVVLRTGQGSSQQLGNDGERVLATDLGVPFNDVDGQRQCVCSLTYANAVPAGSRCNVCIGYSDLVSNYRVPDFVTPNFMADSKNAQSLSAHGGNSLPTRDFEQITEIAAVARELNIPLWIYTRVDTVVDPVFYELTQSTGGNVVRYFIYPGYIDPIYRVAVTGFYVSVSAIALIVLWGIFLPRTVENAAKPIRRPEKQRSIYQPLKEAEALKERMKSRLDKVKAEEELH